MRTGVAAAFGLTAVLTALPVPGAAHDQRRCPGRLPDFPGQNQTLSLQGPGLHDFTTIAMNPDAGYPQVTNETCTPKPPKP